MKNILVILTFLVSSVAGATGKDATYVSRFEKIQSKNKFSTYQTAAWIGKKTKKNAEAVLRRYISASWSVGNQQAIARGIDALKEAGKSHDEAVTLVSDVVGQLTSTVEAMYRQNSNATPRKSTPTRGLASVP